MKKKHHLTQHGQSLVIIALAMLGFLAVLGLVLDGGHAFSKRRSAQNAADAGALAGVRMLCEPDINVGLTPEEQAIDMARYYAITQNQADNAQVFPDLANKEVTVIATIDVDTYFIHLVGIDQIPVQASATAGCFTPNIGRGVLPVAWSCREPVEGWPTDNELCQRQSITWDTLQDYLDDDPQTVHPEMYIVMDSESYDNDFVCIEDDPINGVLTCNLDGDPYGEPDWLASGGRSWLDLDGSEDLYNCNNSPSQGEQELSEWILNGFDCEIDPNTWLPEATGNMANLYQDAIERSVDSPLVVVPVFNDYCPDGDPSGEYEPVPPNCVGKWQGGDLIRRVPAQQPMYFRVEIFAAFYITCARKNSGDQCPGALRAIELNQEVLGQGNNFRSIEGYFIRGISIPDLSGRCEEGEFCPDLGVYTYYLKR